MIFNWLLFILFVALMCGTVFTENLFIFLSLIVSGLTTSIILDKRLNKHGKNIRIHKRK